MKMFLSLCAAPLAACALALAGCAASSPGKPSADEPPALRPASAALPVSRVATITIYRPGFDEEPGGSPTVAVNGADLVTPQAGEVFSIRLPPGTYHFELDGEKAGDLKAAAGQKYYFQLAVVPGGFSGTPRLGIVSPAQGRDETARLTRIDKEHVDNAAFR